MKPQRVSPAAGQESVWDYPRPPRVEASPRHIRIVFNGRVVADSRRAQRVLETGHPPVYYIPPEDVRLQWLAHSPRTSSCEWKGTARYYTVRVGDRRASDAAWAYPEPAPGFAAIRDHIAFYPRLMDACTVDGEQVHPQPGEFYGGWITRDVVGPFKGGPGTLAW